MFVVPKPSGSLRNRAAKFDLRNDRFAEGTSLVEEVKKKRELKAVLEVMAKNLAGDIDATPTTMEDVGHVSKQIKVGIDGYGISIGSPNRSDDHAKSTTEDPLGRIETKRQPLTETQSSKVVDDQNNQLLLQMAMLCESVQMLGAPMKDGFATEGLWKHEDYKKLYEKMSA